MDNESAIFKGGGTELLIWKRSFKLKFEVIFNEGNYL